MRVSFPIAIAFLVASLLAVDFTVAQSQLLETASIVDKKTKETAQGNVTSGKFRAFENRETNSGRIIHLDFVVLHATDDNPKPDPFLFFFGGPGQAAAEFSDRFTNHWIRKDRDIVLISQRGTGGDNKLAFDYQTDGTTSLQQFLEPVMDETTVKKNLARLRGRFDLRMYSTFSAMDDVNDFREAMGYEKINISGGSYGTRACLVYMLRHGETVRTATLAGCAPIEFRNPLYHAEGAQRAIDMIFDEVQSTEKYRDAFGDMRKKFAEIVERLVEEPVTVEIINQSTGKSEPVRMDRDTFVASVRFQMYYLDGSRSLPKLLAEAYEGNFRPFVLSALRQNIGLRQSLALGMLLSVTTAEDVLRIDSAEVEELTGKTFFGSSRVRAQIAAAALWPKSTLPDNFDQPVRSNVPTLIFSGTLDPVTPPKWGEMVHKNFPNSVHVIVPTAHDIGGPCIEQIKQQFLDSGTVDGLKLDCVQKMKLPPLKLPVDDSK